ncbi:MAG: hypothetical protein HY828_04520 [Actinobacteria bacterium]|nr:hypothetical protein [Actinomycetota bacterium]
MTTDPDQSERLVTLRTARPPQPFPHAQATKILTAGVSVSAVFGIIAYLGASASREADAATRELERVAASEAAAAALYRPLPTAAPTTVPPTVVTVAAPQPGTPVQPQVVVVPVATPAPAPAAPAPRPASNQGGQAAPAPANTTRTSG